MTEKALLEHEIDRCRFVDVFCQCASIVGDWVGQDGNY